MAETKTIKVKVSELRSGDIIPDSATVLTVVQTEHYIGISGISLKTKELVQQILEEDKKITIIRKAV
jgi:hypothetical protein